MWAAAAAVVGVGGINLSASLGWFPGFFAWTERTPGGDVTWHVVLVGVATFAIGTLLSAWPRARWWKAMLILGVLVAAEEISQLAQVRRTYAHADLLANLAGWILGTLLSRPPRSRAHQAVDASGPAPEAARGVAPTVAAPAKGTARTGDEIGIDPGVATSWRW